MGDRCVGDAFKIGDSSIIPGRGKILCEPSTALGVSSVTDFTVIGDYPPAGFSGSFFSLLGYDLRDALITLAVVIGTHIEEIVILPVIPAYHLLLPATGSYVLGSGAMRYLLAGMSPHRGG
jgi:hypothetical protein